MACEGLCQQVAKLVAGHSIQYAFINDAIFTLCHNKWVDLFIISPGPSSLLRQPALEYFKKMDRPSMQLSEFKNLVRMNYHILGLTPPSDAEMES